MYTLEQALEISPASSGLIQKVISIKDSMVKAISTGKLNFLEKDHDNSIGRPKSHDVNCSRKNSNSICLPPQSAHSLQRDFSVISNCDGPFKMRGRKMSKSLQR